MQVGLGVSVSSIDMLMTQGAAQRTDNPFDLMIDGDGFMVVGDASGRYYTRAGALRLDDEGNLVINDEEAETVKIIVVIPMERTNII